MSYFGNDDCNTAPCQYDAATVFLCVDGRPPVFGCVGAYVGHPACAPIAVSTVRIRTWTAGRRAGGALRDRPPHLAAERPGVFGTSPCRNQARKTLRRAAQ